MASTGEIILIILAFIIFIVVFALVAVFLYLQLSNSSACVPGNIVNGLTCTVDSDCISCNCDNSFCQPSGKTTGESGASCSAKGASCNTGLICNNSGVCASVPTPPPPAQGKNGAVCSADSNCLSNFCSPDIVNPGNSYCQPSNVQSGTQNSYCGGGAACELGLSCQVSSGNQFCLPESVTPPTTPPNGGGGSKNGVACTTGGDCASGNCSTNPSSSQNFCQPLGVTSGWQGSTCGGSAGSSSSNSCLPGLLCSNGQCVVATAGKKALAEDCSGNSDCTVNMTCAVDSTGGSNNCSNPIVSSNDTYSPVSGSCPFGTVPINGKCLAPTNQMCTTNSQCTNGTCDTNSWGIWSVLTSDQYPAWSYLGKLPGTISKAMAFNSGTTDNVMALVTDGQNPGLYLFDTTSLTNSLIVALKPSSASCGVSGGTLVNFTVSNDGSIIMIALAGLVGSYSLIYPTTPTTSVPISNVNYVGIFQITLNGQVTTCSNFPAPPTIFEATYDVTDAPGILLGPTNQTPTTGINISPQVPLFPGGNASDQTNISNTIFPITHLIDMDLVYDQNTQAPLTVGPRQLLIHGFSDYMGVGSYYLAWSILTPAIDDDELNYPGVRPQSNIVSTFSYCSCSVNCSRINNTNCGDSTKGIVLDNFPSNGCAGFTNPAVGMCYQQSAKTVRGFYSPGLIFPNYPDTVNFMSNYNSLTSAINVPKLISGFSNDFQVNTFPGAFLAGIQTYDGSTSGLMAMSGPSLEIYNNTTWPNAGWVIDFDLFTYQRSVLTPGTPVTVSENMTHAIIYTQNTDGDISVFYVPNIEGSNYNDVEVSFQALPTNIGRYPGYLPNNGRVAIGKSRAFFIGPGICGTSS